ncbi:MAG: extensin family protein [Microlunatus sp.]|nr:extensin family protein [Microlunatus sp.]
MSGQRAANTAVGSSSAVISRRRLLGLGLTAGVGLAAGLTGCSLGSPSFPDAPNARRGGPSCVPRSSLTNYRKLADVSLVYEDNQRRSSFAIDPGFADQLTAWLSDLAELTGWSLDQVWTYGTWTSGSPECSSWHNAGRAIDLTRLRLDSGDFVSARYDRWRDATGNRLTTARRAYWATAASAHKHFAYVLTYLYNEQHHSHLHLDNSRSGSALSRFNRRSRVQVQAVQAICRYLWEIPVELTGSWNRPIVKLLARFSPFSGSATISPTSRPGPPS